jgi:glycosyltransferase involved in cell wall biosynthesis
MNYSTDKKILMIAALGKGDDGMSFASCALRDSWQEIGVPIDCVDFFDNGGSGVGVSKINKIRATFINKSLAKKHINNCDAVYFTPKLSPLGFISLISYYKMCLKYGKPYTLHIHGRALIDTYKKNKWLQPLIRKYISKAHCNIALTSKLRDEMYELFGCGNFKVVGNFAEDALMLKKDEKDKKREIVESDPLSICYMSNVIESKGIFELIEAIGSNDKYSLKIAGRVFPDEKIRFDECLKKYDNIEYLGFVTKDEKRKLLMESTVFCLPTRYPTEAQPISIIESLCMGGIVVATPLPGIVDTLGEDYPDKLYVEKDTKEIAECMDYIYNHRLEIYDTLDNKLEDYQQQFSLDEFAKKIYDCVVS